MTDNQAKQWCFTWTWNNYTDNNINLINNAVDANLFKYIDYGKEIAPSTGTPHLQGYFILKKKNQLNYVKNTIFQSTQISLRLSNTKDVSKAPIIVRKVTNGML